MTPNESKSAKAGHPSALAKVTLKRKMDPQDPVAGEKPKRDHPDFSNGTQMVKFEVKSEMGAIERCLVHRDFACYYSPVLRRAFNSPKQEEVKKIYALENVEQSVFRLFVQWLYTQQLNVDFQKYVEKERAAGEKSNVERRARHSQERDIFGLYHLAETLQIPGLLNIALRQLDDIWSFSSKRSPVKSLLKAVWSRSTATESRLRVIIIDTFAYYVQSGFRLTDNELPPELLCDILRRLGEVMQEWRESGGHIGATNLEIWEEFRSKVEEYLFPETEYEN